jgi:hypothetical protein
MFEAITMDVPESPIVSVGTTSNRGMSPEEVARLCVDKLMSVSETAPPAIKDQAQAFKSDMEKVVAYYMRQAIKSDRTTIYNKLMDAGHPELAEAIRRL